MLMVGRVGFGNPHPTRLTPNEQIVHISMWCLLSAPLLIGCDMTKLDPFTTALLTNDEVIDIDQDPLGRPAGKISKDDSGGEIWARELFDGTHAVGLFNPTPVEQTVAVRWSDIGLSCRQAVRDLWLHEDVGSFDDSYSVKVPAHGIVLVKVGTAAK
jgi:alpha-galactosidase